MAQLQLYIFHTGRIWVDRAIPLHERNPLAVTGLFRGKNKQLVLPVSAYLIVHPRGNVLIDTGQDTICATERPCQLFGIVPGSDAAYLPESFSERRTPGFTVDNDLAAKSLDWLIQCRNDPACRGVFVNHDPTAEEQCLRLEL